MCFYDHNRYGCGCWKWGHFRQHCSREYRIGETCGTKLVHSTNDSPEPCRLCEKVKTKYRRRQAEVDRIQRWSKDSSNYKAGIERAMDVIQQLDNEINTLSTEKQRRLMNGRRLNLKLPASTLNWQQITAPAERRIARRVEKVRHRFDLPVTFHLLEGPFSLAACPDTGASENAMSLELVRLIGCAITRIESEEPRTFRTADGRTLESRGIVTLECGFSQDYSAGPNRASVSCRVAPSLWHSGTFRVAARFEVFDQLCDPVIFGGDFLEKTKTLSEHRYRLRQRPRSGQDATQLVRSLGDTFRGLMCNANGVMCMAVPDTGSTADVISRRYALERNLEIRPNCTKIVFAHGQVGFSSGKVRMRIGIGDAPAPMRDHGIESANDNHLPDVLDMQQPSVELPHSEESQLTSARPTGKEYCDVIETDCLVLDELAVNLIVGIDTLETLEVFTRHQDEFVACSNGRQLNRIIEIGPAEEMIGSAMSSITRRVGRLIGSGQQEISTEDNRRHDQGMNPTLEDQRENARREWENNRVARLAGEDRLRAEEVERARRVTYDAAVAWRTGGERSHQQASH